jgi:CRISPR-associated protein Csb2
MIMGLVLEIEYLAGVAFAAQGPDSTAADWPPQPDRLFSGFVASWGARGEREAEARALKWLESQGSPTIFSSEAEARTPALCYVPPNDAKTGRSGNRSVLPEYRRRQPRRFPATRPHDPIVLFHWDEAAPDDATFQALNQIAADTSYLGHSASLIRCRFLRCDTPPKTDPQSAMRSIYPGRFEELRSGYRQFLRSNGKVGRPRPGVPVRPRAVSIDNTKQSYFSSEWLVLEHNEGEMPDIRAAALVSKEIRDAILSGYRQCGMGDSIPAVISGHTEKGDPVQMPHLAIVPMAFAGYPYADGHVLGFAFVPPRSSGLLEEQGFRRAMRKLTIHVVGEEQHQLRLNTFEIGFSITRNSPRRSLDSMEYTRSAKMFGTVTPIVLDRHLKKSGAERQSEIVEQLRSACRNIGLPQPDLIVPDKHSAIEGVPSAEPSGNAPRWMRWRLPNSLATRALTHAVLRFPVPVEGPVILGAGRFVGLGLCRPIGDTQ